MRVIRFIRRLVLVVFVLVVVVLVVGIAWIATHRDDARTWRQVTVIAADLSDLGTIDRVGEFLAADTRPAQQVQAGNLPATLVTPDDDDEEHPAIVMLVPEGTNEQEEQRLRDVQHAVAGARLTAWTVRVPSADDAFVDATALDELVAALDAIARHDSTRDRRISVLAIGPTASLVLVAAASGPVASNLEALVAVQPIADVRGLVALASTGTYVDAAGRERSIEPSAELRASAGKVVLRAVRQELGSVSGVLDTVLDAAERSPDPLAALEVVPDAVAGPRLLPVLAVLRADTPASFDTAWDRLPERFRQAAQERSPLPVAGSIRARVLVVQATDDDWARADAARLTDALADARSIDVDSRDPGGLVDDAAAVRDVLAVSEWWLRRAGA